MSKARAQELLDFSNRLFTVKEPLHSLWQEIAENIYPERSDFTSKFTMGQDFSANLIDSFPRQLRQKLGDSFSAMLRPKDREWFRTTSMNDKLDADPENARYLEYLTNVLRWSLYDPRSQFIKATKQTDHDYASFGNGVISMDEAPNRQHLFLRNHHLRDCAWVENEITEIDRLDRKDAVSAHNMKRLYSEAKLHESVKKACKDEPHKEINTRVIVMPTDIYGYSDLAKSAKLNKKHPFVCFVIDADNSVILKEGTLKNFPYVVPRWHLISGSPYAFSPAAMSALPDARMAQQLAWILLEAGEKSVEPPMIATEEAVKSMNLGSGMVSWIDYAYDERLGEALRPLKIEGDIKAGLLLRQDVREILAKAFYADRIKLPDPGGGDMTAFEVARRWEEHVRNLLPLFEPIEIEYNAKLLDKAFAVLSNMGAFDFAAMPDALRNADVTWAFESPIQQATNRLLVQQGSETLQAVATARQAGSISISPVHEDKVVKDIIRGISGPATWRKTQEEEDQEAQDNAQKAKIAALAQTVSQGAQIAGQVGEGMGKLQDAGVLPMPAHRQIAGPAPAPRQIAPPNPARAAA